MWVTEFGWATWEDYPVRGARNLDGLQLRLRPEAIMRCAPLKSGSRAPISSLCFLWNLNYAYEDWRVRQRSELAAYSILYPRTLTAAINQRERPALSTRLATRPTKRMP